jgi:hypothetical protein
MPDLSELIKQATEVKARHEIALLERPGVIGVGVGLRQHQGKPTDQVAIIVMVEQPISDLPQEIEGFPVDILNTDMISGDY